MVWLLATFALGLALFYGGKALHDRYDKPASSYDEEITNFEEPDESMWEKSYNNGHFKLRGLNYRVETEGDFHGYILACVNNSHDPKAIAVIDHSFKHLGFLPKGNSYLHAELMEKHNRYLPVNIQIFEEEDEEDGRRYFHGYVDINLDLFPDLDKKQFVTGF